MNGVEKRLEDFVSNVEVIVKAVGIGRAEKIIGASARSIKRWINEGHAPSPEKFDAYESAVREYIAAERPDAMRAEEGVVGEVEGLEEEAHSAANEDSEGGEGQISVGETIQEAAPALAAPVTGQLLAEGMGVVIPLGLIDPNPFQPRKVFEDEALEELKESISQSGLLQPPVVRLVGDRYQLIAGERRTRACRLLGLESIPVIIRVMSDAEVAVAAVSENLQRQDVSQLATARAIRRMVDELGMKQSDIASQLGVTQAKISQMMSLLRLEPKLLDLLEEGKISASIGRTLASLSQQAQRQLNDEQVMGWNVKECQERVNAVKALVEALPTGEVQEGDALLTKFIKLHPEFIHLINSVHTHPNNIEQLKTNQNGFRLGHYYGFETEDDKIGYLMDGMRRNQNLSSYPIKLDASCIDDLFVVLRSFMDIYYPYEEASVSKPVENKEDLGGSDEEVVHRPATPRMTADEKAEALQRAQEASPIPVLSITKSTTKAERLLKRMQEHQGEPLNERSDRCYNCRNFNAEADTYEGRCTAPWGGFSLHMLNRYVVENEPDMILCSKYSPKPEQIEAVKSPGMDTEHALLQLILRGMSGSTQYIYNWMPSLEGKTIEDIEAVYMNEMNAEERAYFISSLSRRIGTQHAYSAPQYMVLPNGERLPVKDKNIVGSDDI
ncbi:ParB/RepB/Spo0J family partition protein [Paenibacillus pasadenensis]|uniref:ParB/RepB/Spo0J family partition protein n=1 Tax=Paenibacillus pasadenensis TaxID=217090 RepID=UPI00040A7711|nr:ParB/RepB/Spo0J family partition protein [Paenibacillus pasadenensis]